MAATDPAKNIKDEVTCCICSDLFKDPVTTECGHSFCKDCITHYCKEKEFNIVCPQCRKRFQKSNLRPNRELKNIVDSIPQLLSSERLRKPIEENICERHGDPLKFYCKEDQTPLCMVCERSQAHRIHTVVPVEEAVQEYWETITEQLAVIESTYGKLHLLVNKDSKHLPQSAGEETHKRLKRLTDSVAILLKVHIKGQRQRFEDLPEPDLKNFCLGKKIAVETELQEHKERENFRERVAEKQETASHVIRVCEEAPTPKYGLDHASLDPVIHNISSTTEDIHYKVDVKSLRRRFEDLMSLKPSVESGVRRTKSASSGGNVALQIELWEREEKGRQVCEEQKEAATCVQKDAETPVLLRRNRSVPVSGEHKLVNVKSHSKSLQDLTSVRAAMDSGVRRQDSISPGGNVAAQTELWGCEVDVALDPATAHPRLILSEDRKSMTCGRDTRQDLPNNPERFDVSVSVLGSEGFTSGRHYWEVEVGVGGHWAVGLARDSVCRKGEILLHPYAGIWVLTSSEIPQFLPKEPRKIRIYLNYAVREVTFYDAENMAPISSHTAKFKGRVVPFFHLSSVGSHITLSPCQR